MTTNNAQASDAGPAKASRKSAASNSTRQPTQITPLRTSKAAAVIALLSRPEGADIEAMTNATGWQAHSVRGFLSGTLKKKMGKAVTSEKTEAGRIYRIVEANAA